MNVKLHSTSNTHFSNSQRREHIMETFIIGVITAVITYIFAFSYMSRPNKKRFNGIFANGIVDIAIGISILVFIGTHGLGIMLTALGIGVGLSLCLRAGKLVFGSSTPHIESQRLKWR